MTSPRHCLIFTDIFGITDAIKTLSDTLNQQGNTVSIVDPYQGVQIKSTHEVDIYQYFLEECGHEHYLAKVNNVLLAALASGNQDIFIIAFSAGASAAWKALDKINPLFKSDQANKCIKHFLGFYPTQIRHHLALTPVCRSTLIFAEREKHFNVKDVIAHLSKSEQVQCIQVPLLHGFMNPLSLNYNPQAQMIFEHMLLQNIKESPNNFHWDLLKAMK